ncbi:MAG: signal peptidase II [Acidobacteriota bacterium]|jgi:signal peptidase II|nr:signal peptidase II [Acidobacteriota bacterium]
MQKSKWLWLLAAPAIWLLDYFTKVWAMRELDASRRSIELVAGYLDFSYAENTGVAFGIFDSVESAWKPFLLAALGLVAVAVILVYYWKSPANQRLLLLALGVVTGGIVGNLTDRVLRGYVVDFIEVHIRDAFYWPNFNVADSAITVGIALLLIDTFLHSRESLAK